MLKKIFLSIFLISCVNFIVAQKEYSFSMTLSPDKEYYQIQKMESKNTIRFNASKEVLHELESRGLENPTIENKNSKKVSTILTGSMDETSGSFPITIDINKVESDNAQEKITEGLRMYGKGYKNKVFEIDSVGNTDMSAYMKDVFVETIDQVMKQIQIHDQTLKIGEHFKQITPLQLPMGQGGTIKMEIVQTYTLTDVKGNLAYFKSDERYKMLLNEGDMNITGGGKGGGTMVYDLEHNYFIEMHNVSSMHLSMEMEQMTMHLNIENKLTNNIKVSDKD